MKLPSGPAAQKIGFMLSRVLIPLWILTGAVFKTVESTPSLLPPTIHGVLIEKMKLEPYMVLATLIVLTPAVSEGAMIQAVLGGGALDEVRVRALDLLGNRNQRLDIGDVLLARLRTP